MSWQDIVGVVNQVFNYKLLTLNDTPITLVSLLVFAVVFGGLAVAVRVATRMIEQRVLTRFTLDTGSQYAISRIIYYVLLVLAIVFSFQFIGLSLGGLAVVFGFLSVGIGFGLQNVTANFVAGLVLLFERPVKVGDRVTVEGFEGDILNINMRASTLQTLDDRTVIVPNSEFVEKVVTNWSHGDRKVRVRVNVGVSYGSDLDTVLDALHSVAKANPEVLDDPDPYVRFIGFGDSSWDLYLACWVRDSDNYYKVLSDLHCSIVREFRARDVEIPFPQHDLHFKTPFAQTETTETYGQVNKSGEA